MIDLDRQLEGWLQEGIISSEQAGLMRASAVAPQPPRDGGQRIPIVAEILGYVGAALAIWAVGFLATEFWDNLADWSQASLFAALGVVLLAAGVPLLDAGEAALRRLAGVLWAGCVIALSGAVFVVLFEMVEFGPSATWTFVGAIASVVGGLMLRRQPGVIQHIVLFAAVATTVIALLSTPSEPEVFYVGLSSWGLGLVWMMLTRSGLLRPANTGIILGGLAMLYGAQIASFGDNGTQSLGILLGLVTAAALAGIGITLKEKVSIILGGFGVFLFVPQSMFHFFGETIGGMFGLFVSGLALVGAAVWLGRRREAQ